MIFRASLFFRLPTAMMAVAALPLLPHSAVAQAAAPAPAQAAQFDPSDVYFQAYLATRAAEQLEKDGEFLAAWEKLDQASKLFESIRTFYPNWKPDMVKGRADKTREAIASIGPKAAEQRKQEDGVIAELEGGAKAPGRVIDPGQGVQPQPPGVLEVDPLTSRRLAEAEAEVARLRNVIESHKLTETEASRNLSRLRDIERQRDESAARLRAAEAHAEQLRAKLAAAPVQNELRDLNQKIQGLEQERDAMSMALRQSRGEHTKTMARIATLEADLAVMRQQAADLDRDLKAERKVANDVIVGQRRQLEELQRKLGERDGELAKAHERINSLEAALQQSQDAFAQLRDEHDNLLQEHAQMSALLKLNEGGRIQELIEQNMGLAKQLREANEKVERLNIDNNQTQDEYTEALTALAVAKSQINKLHQEKRAQEERFSELEKRLKREERALARGQGTSDPAEVEMLRGVIRRQLLSQQRLKQAREYLLEAAQQLGGKDERLDEAIKLFEGGQLVLSPEEQRLLAERDVDGEFTSPFARDRQTVDRATAGLNSTLDSYDRAATKAYASNRLLPARELFQLMTEEHPGHIPALCKLGVVNLKLDDPMAAADAFRRAVELDASNPYAHRMLGFSMFSLNDPSSAEAHVRRAVELAPDDAKGHTLLAAILHQFGRMSEAENHYKAAIAADPLPSEPYFNLAALYLDQNLLDQARASYDLALERGAVPDPKLERRLFNR